MRRAVAATALVIALGGGVATGCSRGGAGELLETARFEEVQRNLPHARKLYAEIVEKYPDSEAAAEARERLAALGPPAAPPPAP